MPWKTEIPTICGPTGSGKTALAISLAEKLALEIVSADSRQLIRHLDIGTAKPTVDDQKKARFHLIDIIEPGQAYNAFKFIEDVDSAIGEIVDRHRLPVVVGGTGLYLRALTEGIFDIESDDNSLRAELEKELDDEGPDKMYKLLQKVDPEEAATFHPNNRIRLIRALEIYRLTGQPKSSLVKTARYRKSSYSYRYYCLMPERQELYRSIENRVDGMIKAGLLAEVEALNSSDWAEPVRRLNVIGYKELLEHLDGNLSLPEAVKLIKQNSRRYAKRQLTWFRNQLEDGFFENCEGLKNRFLSDYAAFAPKSAKKLDMD